MSRANCDGIRIDQCYLQGIYINHKEIWRSKLGCPTGNVAEYKVSLQFHSQIAFHVIPSSLQVIVVICDIKNMISEDPQRLSPRCNCFHPAVQCDVLLQCLKWNEMQRGIRYHNFYAIIQRPSLFKAPRQIAGNVSSNERYNLKLPLRFALQLPSFSHPPSFVHLIIILYLSLYQMNPVTVVFPI